ncbi:ATP-binding cassette domain-containing protein [Actinospica sp. MGRD01-02]|uniref:ATP-binding cassette domain-containing protein n=1 Tax=Actinospica acidithermotolerans TaxID=2828514 RepID=A0A941E6K7_9ACTN|nr:ATP-binding cassette domain-containing protein [Actinospica acidithermotolerans]MBR7824883.1 ATP-binding cassette domain-containing protein [Actinospica acidithermotolerans]
MSVPSDNPVLNAVGLVFPADGSVLRGAHLAVGEREAVAVLGDAGSGKSVLLALLCGMLEPAKGSLWASGRPLHVLPTDQRQTVFRRRFGVLPQDCRLLPELTVAENVALPLRLAGMRSSQAIGRSRVWLERFEIEDHASSSAADLPKPILRRAALARALVGDPTVLLADEPLADLSVPTAESTARILRSIAASHGTAVVVFTREAMTAAYFDRTIKLADGRTDTMAATAPPAAVPLLASSEQAAEFGLPLGRTR